MKEKSYLINQTIFDFELLFFNHIYKMLNSIVKCSLNELLYNVHISLKNGKQLR